MKGIDRSYVIVQEAIRYRIISDQLRRPPTAERESYHYRKHELGLIHPEVVKFFEENPKHRRWKLRYPEEGILPVLMFDPVRALRAEGFFVAPFKREELAVVSDHTLEGVLGEWSKYEKTKTDQIENLWRHLDSFYRTPTEGLMPLKRFREIPVGGVKFEVTDEDLRREIDSLKEIQELEDYNRGGLRPFI